MIGEQGRSLHECIFSALEKYRRSLVTMPERSSANPSTIRVQLMQRAKNNKALDVVQRKNDSNRKKDPNQDFEKHSIKTEDGRFRTTNNQRVLDQLKEYCEINQS